MASLPDGEFLMGSEDRLAYPDDGEGPVRRVRMSSFRIDVFAVTNAAFSRFVDDAGYVTDAERLGWSLVFAADVLNGFTNLAAEWPADLDPGERDRRAFDFLDGIPREPGQRVFPD